MLTLAGETVRFSLLKENVFKRARAGYFAFLVKYYVHSRLKCSEATNLTALFYESFSIIVTYLGGKAAGLTRKQAEDSALFSSR